MKQKLNTTGIPLYQSRAGLAWSGKGKMPKWLATEVEEGGDIIQNFLNPRHPEYQTELERLNSLETLLPSKKFSVKHPNFKVDVITKLLAAHQIPLFTVRKHHDGIYVNRGYKQSEATKYLKRLGMKAIRTKNVSSRGMFFNRGCLNAQLMLTSMTPYTKNYAIRFYL